MKKLTLIVLLLIVSITGGISQNIGKKSLDKKAVRGEFYVLVSTAIISMPNELPRDDVMSTDEEAIYCQQTPTKILLEGRRGVLVSEVVELRLKIKKKGIGAYKSWLGVDKDGNYYLISAITTTDNKAGLIFQPVEKDGKTRRIDRAVVIVSNSSLLCE